MYQNAVLVKDLNSSSFKTPITISDLLERSIDNYVSSHGIFSLPSFEARSQKKL